ncbi:MAG: beta-ketoacyl-ACP synthase II [Oscillospiraceae bacterium]|jgi:3-oxoacyl-[acyl-carrier-protein] synthase II|nr:beta-ketoacyl-ACP synthase II [Oscillospiraceae bacterium]
MDIKRVVITGLGCVTPVGTGKDALWDSVINARHGFAPISRFDTTDFKAKLAAEVKDFDPLLYMARSEPRKTDLYAQYAVAAATIAAEDSGIAETCDPERLGVYIGSGIGGLSTMVAEEEKLLERGASRVSPFFVPMMIGNMGAALVAMKFGARGVNLPIVTACATGTHSIGEAYRAIALGLADAIFAGGSEATITPIAVAGFTNSLALSTSDEPDNCSIPFDRRRHGFVMGEGAGVVVLEEYEHARRRGAHIYCEVAGYGSTCDAYHMTAPDPEATQSARAVTLALGGSDIDFTRLYVNAHGTSTPLNDKTETLALKKALGSDARTVAISSTKSVTGHMLGAAGGVEAIISALAIERGVIPPTAGLREPDPECDLDYTPLTARETRVDAALSLSLGFGGHNAALLLKRL